MLQIKESSSGKAFEVFFDVKQIHNLNGIAVIVECQASNPKNAIAQENQFWAQISIERTACGPQELAKLVRFGDIAEIWLVLSSQDHLLALGFLSLAG